MAGYRSTRIQRVFSERSKKMKRILQNCFKNKDHDSASRYLINKSQSLRLKILFLITIRLVWRVRVRQWVPKASSGVWSKVQRKEKFVFKCLMSQIMIEVIKTLTSKLSKMNLLSERSQRTTNVQTMVRRVDLLINMRRVASKNSKNNSTKNQAKIKVLTHQPLS